MNKFAAVNHLSKPVTELEVLPLLYHAGNVLESARNTINNTLNDSQELPCCLTLPDLSGFMSAYVGETPAPELTDEFAEALSAGLKCKLHNLVIS
jgi:hypothetical protein